MVSPCIDGCYESARQQSGTTREAEVSPRASQDYEGSIAAHNAGIRALALNFAACSSGQSGENIESQIAVVLAIRGVLDEHFGIGRRMCVRCT
jgi:hypothetical protein